MLLLLSSEASRRYGDDIVRILAHPRGTDVQFRYGLQYLDPALLARARAGSLACATALVAFLAADPIARTTTLTSCRLVKVRRSELVGSSCILTLTVGDYLHSLADAELRGKLTAAEQALLPNLQAGGARPTGRFVIDVAADVHAGHVADPNDEMAAFEETAAALGGHAFFGAGQIAFFAVRKILTEDDWRPDWLHTRKRIAAGFQGGRYRLTSGFRYDVEVYTYSPAGSAPQVTPIKLSVASDESAVRFVSGKEAVLDSRYDLNRFTFTTDELLSTLSAGLRVSLQVPAATNKTEQRCDITLPMSFAGRRLLGVTRMVVIAIGTAVPAMIAIKYKDQLNWPIGAVMFAGALVAGWGSVFLGKKG